MLASSFATSDVYRMCRPRPTHSPSPSIINELFLHRSIRLHPYAILDKLSTHHLDWALKEWEWFQNSEMITSDSLINGRLRSNSLVLYTIG